MRTRFRSCFWPSGATAKPLQITDIATNVFKERLQTIPGVSEVQVWGAKRYAMRIWMDPARLASYRLTPLDVRAALLRENIELPSGRLEGQSTELTVRTMSRLTTPEEFNNLIVRETDGRVVRVRDIAPPSSARRTSGPS